MMTTKPCPFLNHLSPSQLCKLLANSVCPDLCLNINTHTVTDRQIIWLNNEGQNVIGLFPKVSWTAYPTTANNKADNFLIVKSGDTNNEIHSQKSQQASYQTSYQMSYKQWTEELVAYCQQQNHNLDQAPSDNTENNENTETTNSATNRYANGLMGFIGYDMSAHTLSEQVSIKPNQPCAYLGHYDVYLTCDINENVSDAPTVNSSLSSNPSYQWQLNSYGSLPNSTDHSSDANASNDHKNNDHKSNDKFTQIFEWLSQIASNLATNLATHTTDESITTTLRTFPTLATLPPAPLSLNSAWQQADYAQAFEQTQNYLYAGDCYQINLTQAWQGKLTDGQQLVDYLPNLHASTNAPFAGYLQLGVANATREASKNKPNKKEASKFELLSCSPELFFTFNQSGNQHHIITKPIKGTRPRGTDTQSDQQLKNELANSEKDLAENVMIVDLLRNDLGKYAQTGTVKVPKRFAIESFSNVHHMVSTITATLKQDVHPIEVLLGSLPAGSITGTPKKRAVEIIHELETANNGSQRGAYCGTLGYMNFDGTGQWNVLIRTLQAYDNTVSLWAGGGITVASHCEAEYQECWDKVGNLVSVLRG